MQTKKIFRWCLIRFFILTLILLLVILFRHPLLRSIGNYLIHEDELQKSEVIFVLSGGPHDRANEAARLLHAGWAPYVVCTGEQIPLLFKVINETLDECDLSRISLIKAGVDSSKIEDIHIGASTRAESHAILAYCKAKQIKKIIVVSDKFHTNRIDYAFRDLFEDEGIELILRGAPSSGYDENLWWAEEAGLLMVNNEYVKLFYYFLKY